MKGTNSNIRPFFCTFVGKLYYLRKTWHLTIQNSIMLYLMDYAVLRHFSWCGIIYSRDMHLQAAQ